jgi:hypothetical protein
VRFVVIAVALSGCSSLLGVSDPHADVSDANRDGPGSDGGSDAPIDSAIDMAPVDHIAFNVTSIQLAQQQVARIKATLVFAAGGSQDVTATATWSSDDSTVAAADVGGVITAQLLAGTANITASAAGLTGTFATNVTATACHPIINEIQAGGAISAADEWVEILNPCAVPIDVEGWTIVYRAASFAGATDTNLMITLTGSLAPGDLKLFAGGGFPGIADGTWASGFMQANNGAVGLRSGPKDIGPLVDAVAYGTVAPGHPFVEGTATPALSNNKSASRVPFDGNDTDHGGSDFTIVGTPTPRALNTP